MTSSKGNKIANQFIIKADNVVYFQSYSSIISKRDCKTGQIYLDIKYWNFSVTTGKYRNIFLNESKKETQSKINNGTYILTDLN